MGVRVKVIRPPALQSDRRDINVGRDNLADALRQIDPINAGLDARLVELEHSRVMPLDSFDRMVWPCDDATGSAILRNIGPEGGALTIAGSIETRPCGFVATQAARINVAASGTNARTTATWTTAPPSASMSCWVRVGSIAAGSNVVSFADSAGVPIFSLSVSTPGSSRILLGGNVRVGGTNFTINALDSEQFSIGDWHHIGVTYDGETLLGYVDGVEVASNGTPTGPINWTLGAAPRNWNLGAESASVIGFLGRQQDVRVMNVARPESWFTESYRRGVGLYREAA